MQRMQIYISEEQRQILNLYSEQDHQSVSNLIRQAIDMVYFNRPTLKEVDQALEGSFAIWGKRDDIKSTDNYVRGLRKRWHKPS